MIFSSFFSSVSQPVSLSRVLIYINFVVPVAIIASSSKIFLFHFFFILSTSIPKIVSDYDPEIPQS